jgi:hypothetical protein
MFALAADAGAPMPTMSTNASMTLSMRQQMLFLIAKGFMLLSFVPEAKCNPGHAISNVWAAMAIYAYALSYMQE